MTTKPKPTCDNCKSVDVYRKRIAYYEPSVGQWIDDPFCDEFHCNQCGNEHVDLSPFRKAVAKELSHA